MPDDTFGACIRARAAELKIVDDQGRATPARLAEYLNDRWRLPLRKRIKRRTVESWFLNERVPRIGRLLRLLSVLNIHGEDHARVLKLAGAIDPDDGDLDDEAHEPSIDDEGCVVVPRSAADVDDDDGPLTVKDFELLDPDSSAA